MGSENANKSKKKKTLAAQKKEEAEKRQLSLGFDEL